LRQKVDLSPSKNQPNGRCLETRTVNQQLPSYFAANAGLFRSHIAESSSLRYNGVSKINQSGVTIMPRQMIQKALAQVDLSQKLATREQFHPFPTYIEHEAWANLPHEARNVIQAVAGSLDGRPIPALPATLYMEYWREGNRNRFETQYFARRKLLIGQTLGVCLNEGPVKAVDDLIDTIWAICEESTWVLPAHNTRPDEGGYGREVVDIAAPIYVDLFSAETASMLSWVRYLVGERLDTESALVTQRMEYEIRRRVLEPYAACDYFSWMGLNHNDPVNNWNPWINANVLAAALLIENDQDTRITLVKKIGASMDRFIEFYAEDGGCDEGPSYFDAAGAALLDGLGLLYEATGGSVSVYSEPLIRNMAEYITHAHIAGSWYLNFADAGARLTPSVTLLERAAAAVKSDHLASWVAYMKTNGLAENQYAPRHNHVYRQLCDLFRTSPTGQSIPSGKPIAVRDHFFAGIQVFIAREASNSAEGLIIAGKGGANNESHNHNDIGNYVLYLDGEPCVVDIGVETYSRKTFSAERYDIWAMQSGNHNTAVINGCDQMPGPEYAAKGIKYNVDGDITTFTLDMAAAYGGEAHVESYRRTFTFDRAAKRVTVSDDVKLMEANKPIALPIILAVKPTVEPGRVFVPGKRTLILSYDPSAFDIEVIEAPIPDARLQLSWKRPTLYKAVLTRKEVVKADKFELTYHAE
jgi:hypothetical protein